MLINATAVIPWCAVYQAYSHDASVVSTAAHDLLVVAAYVVLDAFQCVGQGVLRGGGKQTIGAVVGLACYYGVTLPAAYLFGFTAGFGLPGLWYGLLLGNGCVAVVYVIAVARIDWAAAAAAAVATATAATEATEVCSEAAVEESEPDVSVGGGLGTTK